MREFKRYISKSPIVAAVSGLLIVYIIYRLYVKAKKAKNDAIDSIVNNAVTNGINDTLSTYHVAPVRQKVVVGAANEIYECLFKYMFGMFENERGVESAFKTLRDANEVVACAEIYRATFNRSLYDDIEQYCSLGFLDGIQEGFLNALKNSR